MNGTNRLSSILAVDVGGSGLRAQLADGSGRSELFESYGAAITADGIYLEPLLGPVEEFASRHRSRPHVVVWSMRGLLGLTDPQYVLRQVHSRLRATRTVVASDAVTSLVGAMGEVRPAAVLAAGTGAVAFATDFADVWRMVDGWGHVLGDRGSGAWIALEALRAALAAEDGVPGGSPSLNEAARAFWGPPRTWPRAVMTTSDAQARLAAFAPVVASLAGEDPVAARVLGRAAAHLADSLESAISAVPGCPATAVGGLLRNPQIATAFDKETRQRGIDLVAASGTALDGALTLGRHISQGRSLRERAPYLTFAGRG